MSDKMTNRAKEIQWGTTIILLAALLSWLLFYRVNIKIFEAGSLLRIILITLCYALLSLATTQLINIHFSIQKKHYRTSFLTLTIFGLIMIITTSVFHTDLALINQLPLIPLSSFIGVFIATGLSQGWSEDNAPPSSQIEAAVLQCHQAYLDEISKGNFEKRLFDIFLAALSLLISTPVWIIIIFLIWWEDPGPVLFVKNSVGRRGFNFKQFKFRSMILHAEKETGPIIGYENDERVLFFGRFLRKTALDELPQMINILRGDMSYVGPRPQRTVLVYEYLQALPIYAARHTVRPGLAGLAQVADSYDISPQEKLAWDLLYIEHANLWFDLKLALAAFLLVFVLRWRSTQKPEKVIRQLLGIEKPTL
jgi:lipopolysaccharide/colanic/teichoic acid biosynthesis glycosyltransferase